MADSRCTIPHLFWRTASAALLTLAACGPAPGWVEEPETAAPEADPDPTVTPSAPGAACSLSTPAVRLQGRMSRQTSVEGMNVLACPTPPEPGR